MPHWLYPCCYTGLFCSDAKKKKKEKRTVALTGSSEEFKKDTRLNYINDKLIQKLDYA